VSRNHCWRYQSSPRLEKSPWTHTHTTSSECKPSTPDHRVRVVFCQWLLAKCVANTQFVANIIFNENAGFTRDGIVNFHNTHVWVDDNPHTIVTSRHQHRFSTSIWVGILDDQLLWPVVLPNRLTGAANHRFLGNYLRVLGTFASSSTKTHVVHAWWGTTSFSPHCQTASEADFWWTVDRTRRPSKLACMIPWP
jgi:hypothetical protein